MGIRRLCVYCGSSNGAIDDYAAGAEALAALLVQRQIGLVYGGASRGTMGVIADAVLRAGGEVTGVMPKSLNRRELIHTGLTELHVVDSMHERKALMAELSDGFVALPGGFGTLEEIIEILTWGQLRFHSKPCGILNVANYYAGLLQFLDHAVDQGFIRSEHRRALIVDADPAALLSRFDNYLAPTIRKWQD